MSCQLVDVKCTEGDCRAWGSEVNEKNGKKADKAQKLKGSESSGAAADGDSCPGGDFTTVIINV